MSTQCLPACCLFVDASAISSVAYHIYTQMKTTFLDRALRQSLTRVYVMLCSIARRVFERAATRTAALGFNWPIGWLIGASPAADRMRSNWSFGAPKPMLTMCAREFCNRAPPRRSHNMSQQPAAAPHSQSTRMYVYVHRRWSLFMGKMTFDDERENVTRRQWPWSLWSLALVTKFVFACSPRVFAQKKYVFYFSKI